MSFNNMQQTRVENQVIEYKAFFAVINRWLYLQLSVKKQQFSIYKACFDFLMSSSFANIYIYSLEDCSRSNTKFMNTDYLSKRLDV